MSRKFISIGALVLALLVFAAAALWLSRKSISRNLVTKGFALLEEKNYNDALRAFEKAWKWNGRSSRALLGMSEAGYHLSQFDKALEQVNKSIVIDSLVPDAFFYRGLIHMKLDDKAKAIADFTKTVGFDSLYAQAYYHRGIARAGMADFKGSVEDYRKAMSLDGKNIEAYLKSIEAKSALDDFGGWQPITINCFPD
jgi:tetratricopeptide (TPR) repeat protein